jgi:hypothetical protein
VSAINPIRLKETTTHSNAKAKLDILDIAEATLAALDVEEYDLNLEERLLQQLPRERSLGLEERRVE